MKWRSYWCVIVAAVTLWQPVYALAAQIASDEVHISAIYNTSRTVQHSAEHISQIRHQGSQGQALAQFDYQHNRDGQRTQAKETIHSNGQTLQRTIDWSYDPAGKLTQEHITQTQPTAQTLSIAYQYDKVGNRTARTVTGAINQTTTYQYDQNDRLTQTSDSLEGTTSYRYDQRGNLVEKANGANITQYSWNSDSHLIKVEHSNSGTVTKTTTYGYDPQGRRIKKLVQQGASKTETHYSLDSERSYHEVAVESTRVNTQPWTHKTYVHTPGGVGELISQSEGTTTKQIYADAQGSTRLITDSATGASQSYSFDAFGNWLVGDAIAASQNPPTHLYTGERFDADTGLIYLRARDYDPAIGRFISMDEHPGNQRIPLTLNKYLYANADPVNHIDPSGNMSVISMPMPIAINLPRLSVVSVAALKIRLKIAIYMAIINAGANIAIDAITMAELNKCMEKGRRGERCDFDESIFVVGDSAPEVRDHIGDAIAMGYPKRVSKRFEPHDRYWLKAHKGPGKACSNAPGTDCDEYPMAAHNEGGPHNHPSLRSVNFSQNRSVGGRLRWLHEHCKIQTDDEYFVLPLKGVPVVGYICGR